MLSRVRRPRLAVVLALLVVAGCTTGTGVVEPPPPGERVTTTPPAVQPRPAAPAPLGTDRGRQSKGVVAAGSAGAPYNYAPTLLREGGKYRMWWCSQLGSAAPPGDDLLLAETTDLAKPFRGPDGSGGQAVFSGSRTGFDGMHTCDPSVIRVGGIYYLYYTGAAGDHAHGNAIGLATSTDGKRWTRANGGRPIVTSARDELRDNAYGAGQPAAVFLDGRFHLMFTDTTGRAAGWNGAGQFVLRSSDPAFRSGVEVLGPDGFVPGGTGGPRLRSVVDAFSVDFMWVDALAAFAIAHETDGGTTLTFWDREFRTQPYDPVLVPGPWAEGPGLVRNGSGHAVPSRTDPCDRVPVDLVRATRVEAAPTDLAHFGLDLTDTAACDDPARILAALDGFAVPSPRRTVDVIRGGRVLRVERRSVAERISYRVLPRVPGLDAVPVAAHLPAGAPAVRAGSRVGFVLDDGRLWTITDPVLLAVNGSRATEISQAEWDAYPRGAHL
ncbi:beta-xylosidase [Actinokineospora fastidiosa]|uniref:Beta-xylosidase n=1 Tax=Actinokineospora fastidiosa TaxID=1816 RepID=A0A918GU06_9PSEU|nr:beta-xylosidase [Actinokineospora fastidiosa]GGS60560.1 beta-xylosidase [Actinokineospora fastidiosa]